jgi:sugar O-acyltransferase (sialic acid O-acetyltransferase NeuD family)
VTGTLHVFGAGGHGREVAWLAAEVLGDDVGIVFLVDDEAYLTGPVDGHPVRLLTEATARPGDTYVVAVGDADLRKRAAASCADLGLAPATLVHPRVERSATVSIGPGSVVAAGCVLTTNIEIGRHVHVNVGCTISHDALVGDYVTISPGVHVAGHVTLEEGCFLGIGATVLNGTAGARLVVGAGAVVAAGACVIGDVDPGTLVAGVPAVVKPRPGRPAR